MNKIENNWQKILSQGFSTAKDLLQFLQIKVDDNAFSAEKLFKTRVPIGFAEKMERGNINDPLLLQVLAVEKENFSSKEFIKDPLQEKNANPIKGLLHKYKSRVLIIPTSACAVHCRYCFRRHFSYEDNLQSQKDWDKTLDYIAGNNDIKEVIFSGGDPLMAKNSVLLNLLEKISNIKHVSMVRFHSRMPVVLPERIDEDFIEMIKNISIKKVMILHINHPNEIDEKLKFAVERLKNVDVTVLNQSVLLQNINDNVNVLTELSYKLFSAGILPYYLHIPDKVEGTEHFYVSIEKGQEIFAELQKNLSGYLVPRLVKEYPGIEHKVLMNG